MSKSTISEFADYVRGDAPGCPDTVLEQVVIDVLIDFCTKTLLWREDMYPQSGVKNLATYELVAPTGAMVVQPITLFYAGTLLVPTMAEVLDKNSMDWRSAVGSPQRYVQVESGVIRFDCAPAETQRGAITGTLAFKPKRNAAAVPEWIFQEWVDVIAIGAKARLLLQPNKPWTNVQDAAVYNQQYTVARAGAKIKASKGNLAGLPQRIDPRRIV